LNFAISSFDGVTSSTLATFFPAFIVCIMVKNSTVSLAGAVGVKKGGERLRVVAFESLLVALDEGFLLLGRRGVSGEADGR
jgi:hypothetical protein